MLLFRDYTSAATGVGIKMKNNEKKVTISAILALCFLFIMTATQGKYWGDNTMETYIIQITEGSDETYLDSSTPTAMVVNQGDINPNIRVAGVPYAQDCPIIEEQYVINNGRKVAKVIIEDCTAKKEIVKKETKHDTTYS